MNQDMTNTRILAAATAAAALWACSTKPAPDPEFDYTADI